jgi:hypothetical protein
MDLIYYSNLNGLNVPPYCVNYNKNQYVGESFLPYNAFPYYFGRRTKRVSRTKQRGLSKKKQNKRHRKKNNRKNKK